MQAGGSWAEIRLFLRRPLRQGVFSRFGVDDGGDAHTEILVDHHHLAFGQQLAVDQDVERFTRQTIKFDDLPGGQFQDVLDDHVGATEFDRERDLDVAHQFKIGLPGDAATSLTGQPSACGTAREVGTFAHRLPADMVVMNPKHRATAEQVWNLPPGTIPAQPGYHAVLQNRMLKDGKLKCYWTSTTNNMQAGPNINGEILPGWRNPATFVVVSDAYPTVSAMAALASGKAGWFAVCVMGWGCRPCRHRDRVGNACRVRP